MEKVHVINLLFRFVELGTVESFTPSASIPMQINPVPVMVTSQRLRDGLLFSIATGDNSFSISMAIARS